MSDDDQLVDDISVRVCVCGSVVHAQQANSPTSTAAAAAAEIARQRSVPSNQSINATLSYELNSHTVQTIIKHTSST